MVYYEDFQSTRLLHAEIAHAYRGGREYWANHPNERPNEVQENVSLYLVRTGLLPPLPRNEPEPEPIFVEEPAPLESAPSTPKRRGFLRLSITSSRKPSKSSLVSPSSPPSSNSSRSLRSVTSLLPRSPSSPSSGSLFRMISGRTKRYQSSLVSLNAEHGRSVVALQPSTSGTTILKQRARRSTVSGMENLRVSNSRSGYGQPSECYVLPSIPSDPNARKSTLLPMPITSTKQMLPERSCVNSSLIARRLSPT